MHSNKNVFMKKHLFFFALLTFCCTSPNTAPERTVSGKVISKDVHSNAAVVYIDTSVGEESEDIMLVAPKDLHIGDSVRLTMKGNDVLAWDKK
jgi:hypothetical protein